MMVNYFQGLKINFEDYWISVFYNIVEFLEKPIEDITTVETNWRYNYYWNQLKIQLKLKPFGDSSNVNDDC